jgi:hypothetical protein
LSTFSTGTYDEFKNQVMKSYPKAEEVMKGSMTALKRKLRKIDPIATDERDELLKLVRVMTAEVAKLKQITPPIHTNRELVELFLTKLTPEFAARIAHKLSVHRMVGTNQNNPQNRNPEDMFDIDEVMEMAKHTALENANPFGKFLWTSPGMQSNNTSVKMEEMVAKLTDSINLQAQYNRQVDQKLSSLQSFMTQPRSMPTTNFAAQTSYNRGLMPTFGSMQPNSPNICFYCRDDRPHRICNCDHANVHLDLGWIKKIDGQLRMPDGSKVPRDGNKTMKEVIENLNQKKPGIIPMSKIQDKSSFFQDGPAYPSYAYQQGNNSETENLNNLLDLINKIGVDKIQHLLNTRDMSDDKDDQWNQNFD